MIVQKSLKVIFTNSKLINKLGTKLKNNFACSHPRLFILFILCNENLTILFNSIKQLKNTIV